jgi:hypothetical protein
MEGGFFLFFTMVFLWFTSLAYIFSLLFIVYLMFSLCFNYISFDFNYISFDFWWFLSPFNLNNVYASFILIPLQASNKLKKFIISAYQQEAICGLLLGDGCLSDPNNRGVISAKGSYRMEFSFQSSSLDFIKWLKFVVLGNLSTNTSPTPYPKNAPTQYTFNTSQNSYFTTLAFLWYIPHPNPTPRLKVLKVLPPIDYLTTHFTPVALAFLIMGDGYWETDSETVFICTESFSNEEVLLLIGLLDKSMGLKATPKIRKNKNGEDRYLRFFNMLSYM